MLAICPRQFGNPKDCARNKKNGRPSPVEMSCRNEASRALWMTRWASSTECSGLYPTIPIGILRKGSSIVSAVIGPRSGRNTGCLLYQDAEGPEGLHAYQQSHQRLQRPRQALSRSAGGVRFPVVRLGGSEKVSTSTDFHEQSDSGQHRRNSPCHECTLSSRLINSTGKDTCTFVPSSERVRIESLCKHPISAESYSQLSSLP